MSEEARTVMGYVQNMQEQEQTIKWVISMFVTGIVGSLVFIVRAIMGVNKNVSDQGERISVVQNDVGHIKQSLEDLKKEK